MSEETKNQQLDNGDSRCLDTMVWRCDFDYVYEQVVAHGKTYNELLIDAKHYKKQWSDYLQKEL